jgi:hypothetical protein
MPNEECIDGPEGCEGPTENRTPLSASGVSFPRCEGHWEKRLDKEQRLRQDYPDSPNPPAWFGPTSGGMNEWGEYWDEY